MQNNQMYDLAALVAILGTVGALALTGQGAEVLGAAAVASNSIFGAWRQRQRRPGSSGKGRLGQRADGHRVAARRPDRRPHTMISPREIADVAGRGKDTRDGSPVDLMAGCSAGPKPCSRPDARTHP